jgi:hypothetical protein
LGALLIGLSFASKASHHAWQLLARSLDGGARLDAFNPDVGLDFGLVLDRLGFALGELPDRGL